MLHFCKRRKPHQPHTHSHTRCSLCIGWSKFKPKSPRFRRWPPEGMTRNGKGNCFSHSAVSAAAGVQGLRWDGGNMPAPTRGTLLAIWQHADVRVYKAVPHGPTSSFHVLKAHYYYYYYLKINTTGETGKTFKHWNHFSNQLNFIISYLKYNISQIQAMHRNHV